MRGEECSRLPIWVIEESLTHRPSLPSRIGSGVPCMASYHVSLAFCSSPFFCAAAVCPQILSFLCRAFFKTLVKKPLSLSQKKTNIGNIGNPCFPTSLSEYSLAFIPFGYLYFLPSSGLSFFSACYYIWPQSGDVAHFALALISAIVGKNSGVVIRRLLRTPTKDASYSSLHLGAVTSAPSFICGPPPSWRLRSEWSIPVPPPLSYYRCSLAAYIYI